MGRGRTTVPIDLVLRREITGAVIEAGCRKFLQVEIADQ